MFYLFQAHNIDKLQYSFVTVKPRKEKHSFREISLWLVFK